MRASAVVMAAVAAACAGLTAACGHPFSPPGYDSSRPYANITPWEPGPSLAPAPKGPMTVGVDLFDTRDRSVAETKVLGQRALSYIANTLGVKSVGIAWEYTVPSKTSDQVNATSSVTPDAADIAALTRIARSYGLKVSYRVLFEVAGQSGQSESLRPQHTSAWLSSLLAAETPALQVAEAQHVPEFIVGTETVDIEDSPLWRGFFAQASRMYHGTLSYATWGGSPATGGFFSRKRVLPPVSLYGTTAYPPVELNPSSATVSDLTGAWESFLRHVPAPVLARTAMDEIGIPATDQSYARPWEWNKVTGQRDDQVQARWFSAACAAAIKTHMRAIYFWNVNLADNPAFGVSESAVRFAGRAASETAIRGCVQASESAG